MTPHRLPIRVFALWLALVSEPAAWALTNGLALTPPMGWNDWNTFGCGISDAVVRQTADVMAASGMKAAGYQFVNIDDCWATTRNSNGVIGVNSSKFPNGIKAVADYVHSKGLKLGLYTDHGTNTCSSSNPPGSYGYEYVDAMTYAAWGVDYLKNDSCKLPVGDIPYEDYFRMADGLMDSGRPIVNSLCPNAAHYEYWSPDVGNLWRTTGDIRNTFASMVSKIDPNSKSAYLAGPGRWNDPDMLEVGRGDFTNLIPAQSHFTMWCIMAGPLLAGNDITTMSAQTLAVLTNAEAIAVDQDPAGEQGIRVGGTAGSAEVWSKPLGYDFTTRAVALFNRLTNSSAVITCYWTNLALQAGAATVRDLWAHANLGTYTNSYTATVPAAGVVFLKIVGTPPPPPPLGTNYLSDLQPIYAYTGSGTLTKDKSIGGNTITLNGVTYTKGIGTHAIGGHEYNLGGIASRFQSDVGVDDEVGSSGSVIFQVLADGLKIYDSGIMTGNSLTKTVDLDVTGVRRLTLGVTDTGNDVTGNRNLNDHSDWAGARITVTNTTPRAPAVPAGLTARPGSQISLAWNPARGAINYNVKRATASGGPYTTIASAPFAAYADTNVTLGTTYYYVVSATSGFGESANSSQAAAAACSPPGVPTGVTTTPGVSQVVVRWSPAAGATSYTVSRFGTNTPITVLATGIAATNYTDLNPLPGAIHYYLVSAVNACNQSPYSAFAAATIPPAAPSAPTGLTATAGNAVIGLTWTPVPGAASYRVKRSTTAGGPYSTIASNLTSPGYLDAGLSNDTTYYYVVSAVNGAGESANSAETSATPFAPVTAYWTNGLTGAAQNWNVNANWTNASVFPNSLGVAAIVNANIPAAQSINLNQPITVGSLSLGDADGSAAYTIAANGGTLTFNNGTNVAVLTELAGSPGDRIAAPITLATNLAVLNNSVNALTLAGAVSGPGDMTINNGTVQIGDGATSGSLGVDVTDNGALIFARSDAVTVTNVLSGAGTLAKNGAGVLTLNAANTYSGATTVAQGTLRIANPAALGTTAGGTTVYPGATLDLNHTNLGVEPVTVSGSGVGGNGALVDNSGNASYVSPQVAYVTLTGDTVFGGTGRWDLRSNPNNGLNAALNTGGHPYKVTKVGANQVSIVGVVVDPALGDIDIQRGLMGWETTTTSMGNPASNLIVRAGAALSFYQSTNRWNKNFILYGDSVNSNIYNWSGANVVAGPIQLNGACVFYGGGTSLALSNVVSGTGSLVKNGPCTLILAADNSYSGNTTVNGGILALNGPGSISHSPTITLAPGATLDITAHNGGGMTLASGQTLNGTGTVKGNLTVGNGATLAPGASFGTLTFSNALTLAGGGTTILELGKSPTTNDLLEVAGTLTYGGTLRATNVSATPLAAGDSFKLFNAAAYTGAFTNLAPATPGPGLAWNTNTLTSGTLNVVSTDFTIDATPLLRSTPAGGSASYDVTLTGLSGFNGPVTLGVSGFPAGTSCSFSQTNLNGSGTSTLTVFTATNTPAGNYPLIITGTSGSLFHSTSVTLAVNDFGLSATPGSRVTLAGGSVTCTVAVAASNGFSGIVTLGVSDLPPGTGWSLSQTNVNGSGAATLTVTTSTNTAAGNYPLTITGTSGGLTHSAAVTLSVTDFAVAVTPAVQTVTVGNSTNWLVHVNGSNGFADVVTLSVAGLAASAGYGLSPTNVTGSGTSILTVTTSDTLGPGEYPLTISAASGGLTRTDQVTLLARAAANLVWIGSASADWDVGLTANWLDWDSNAPAVFAQGDHVRFIETNGVATNINLGAGVAVEPGAMIVEADSTAYRISGAGKISGRGSLVKGGGGLLTLETANDFTGGTAVSAGTLALVGGGTLGGGGTIYLGTGAVLDVSGRANGALTLGAGQYLESAGRINGSLATAPGAVVSRGTNGIGPLTVTNTVTLGGAILLRLDAQDGTNDVLAGAQAVNYGGTLRVTNVAGSLLVSNRFKLFDAANYTGAFTSIVPPSPGNGLAWDSSDLTNNGTLAVIAALVPPSPCITGIVPAANSVMFYGTNGVPGGYYYLMATTNAAQPLTNWAVVATNVFDGVGNFVFTNGVAPGRGYEFYRLQLP